MQLGPGAGRGRSGARWLLSREVQGLREQETDLVYICMGVTIVTYGYKYIGHKPRGLVVIQDDFLLKINKNLGPKEFFRFEGERAELAPKRPRQRKSRGSDKQPCVLIIHFSTEKLPGKAGR